MSSSKRQKNWKHIKDWRQELIKLMLDFWDNGQNRWHSRKFCETYKLWPNKNKNWNRNRKAGKWNGMWVEKESEPQTQRSCISPAHANRAQRTRRTRRSYISPRRKGAWQQDECNNPQPTTNNSPLGPANGTVQFRFGKNKNLLEPRKQKRNLPEKVVIDLIRTKFYI